MYLQVLAFINAGRVAGGVLLHCIDGISRSTAVIMAYVMHDQVMAESDAFQYVSDRRCCVQIHTAGTALLLNHIVVHLILYTVFSIRYMRVLISQNQSIQFHPDPSHFPISYHIIISLLITAR